MDTEKKKQVASQCKVVECLARTLAGIHHDYTLIFDSDKEQSDGWMDLVGNRTARLMETLGDVLNGMDANDPEDDWVNPIFEKAHAMFPQSKV